MIGVERADFVGVLTQDLERAKKFYGETLGLEANPLAHPDWPEFQAGNLTILLMTPEGTGIPFSPSATTIALRVPDVEAACNQLQDAGVEFNGETYDSTVCHMAFFSDPDGNALMLHRRYAPFPDGSQP